MNAASNTHFLGGYKGRRRMVQLPCSSLLCLIGKVKVVNSASRAGNKTKLCARGAGATWPHRLVAQKAVNGP